MNVGVVFPQTEIGPDAGAIRAYAQAACELAFTHVRAYDHVVGADPAVHKDWDGPYDVRTTFHEPFALYGYLAALTDMPLIHELRQRVLRRGGRCDTVRVDDARRLLN